MKIAILADPLDNQSAGVHTYTKGMVNALIQYDQINEYVLIRQRKDPSFSANVRQIGVPIFPYIPFFSSFRLFVLIPLVCRWQKVKAVVEPAHFGPFNLPASIKRITVIHDLTPLLFPQYHRLYGRSLQKLFLPRILRRADKILTVSEHSKKDINKQFPFTTPKTKVIYPGRDPFFYPDHSPKVLKKFGVDYPFFLSVGTIEPRKNLVLLIKAFERYCKLVNSETFLVIAGGKGWKSEKFFEALEQHPFRKKIRFVGRVSKEDLRVLYSHSIALIYPSIYEGFGLPILEAYSCGTAVICSNSSSLPEVGGKLATYFDPLDEIELVESMSKLYCSFRNRALVKDQFINFSKTFFWRNYVHEFMKMIKET